MILHSLYRFNVWNRINEANEEDGIISFLETGDLDNIDLAEQIAIGLGLDINKIIENKFGELFDIVGGYPYTTKSLKIISKIKEIRLPNFDLKSIPSEISILKDAYILDLRNNELSSIPESIGDMNLKSIHISSNSKFTKLPNTICKLRELVVLAANYCDLREIPNNIDQLTELNILWLSGNKNLSTIPESLTNLQNLERLYLNRTAISSLPTSMSKLSNNLEYLNIRETNISRSEVYKLVNELPYTTIISDYD